MRRIDAIDVIFPNQTTGERKSPTDGELKPPTNVVKPFRRKIIKKTS